jgi:hypothetical protein
MLYPKYSYPTGLFVRALWDFLLMRHRDMRHDAIACIEHMDAELRVLGKENIPQQGTCVLTINHYYREGFGAQWLALATTAMVPLKMRWVVTGELMCQGKWYRPIAAPGSRVFLKRLAQLYGLTTMPPMPPRPKDVVARAASVRKILEYVRDTNDPVLGISPEGYNPPSGVLSRPATGFGRFGLLLAKTGLRFIPVGGYEAAGVFHLHFGAPYELSVRNHLSTDERDEHAIRIIMENISRLLPLHLRGEFA